MTIKEIVKKYLEDNGFDGLVNKDYAYGKYKGTICGCVLKDFMPCLHPLTTCEPDKNVLHTTLGMLKKKTAL